MRTDRGEAVGGGFFVERGGHQRMAFAVHAPAALAAALVGAVVREREHHAAACHPRELRQDGGALLAIGHVMDEAVADGGVEGVVLDRQVVRGGREKRHAACLLERGERLLRLRNHGRGDVGAGHVLGVAQQGGGQTAGPAGAVQDAAGRARALERPIHHGELAPVGQPPHPRALVLAAVGGRAGGALIAFEELGIHAGRNVAQPGVA